jgi:hypothetical protein
LAAGRKLVLPGEILMSKIEYHMSSLQALNAQNSIYVTGKSSRSGAYDEGIYIIYFVGSDPYFV